MNKKQKLKTQSDTKKPKLTVSNQSDKDIKKMTVVMQLVCW
ncbi:hypothetical protein SAMN04488029_2581 [Reichenbachiella faecimaris]|uniref:Uncharacterized protein n=1 Tax=Reichenbachiella faecimaris TaxID=692418 RepID=A0A1W2GGT3_REIFA|nr:hypothetical protein [Reichenbachiella faecimaris]SMD35873.1 hypothetical protein SAMN04488029_2581 [Reichenbachiella faecimaris]